MLQEAKNNVKNHLDHVKVILYNVKAIVWKFIYNISYSLKNYTIYELHELMGGE